LQEFVEIKNLRVLCVELFLACVLIRISVEGRVLWRLCQYWI